MTQKKPFYTELAYIAGILILAMGTAFMERADFGMSMVVTPAYIIHRKVSETLPFYTFGMSEYVLQACILIVLALLMRRLKKGYLCCFGTAVFYGLALDQAMGLVSLIPETGTAGRVLFFAGGFLLCALSISFLFHTYLPPEAYELFVKEVAAARGWDINKVKTVYDITSCAVSVVLSFLFFGFGHFVGVKAGTFLTALINGWTIGRMSRFLESRFDFRDGLPWRNFFEN